MVDLILDRGVVVDSYARACFGDFEIAAADGRMVTGSIDGYLRFADQIGRLGSGPSAHARP